MTRLIKLALFLALFSPFLKAQSFYSFPPFNKYPGASFYVCGVPVAPAAGGSCSNQVTIYADQTLLAPITQPATIGREGNYGFWVPSTTSQITVLIGDPYKITYVVNLGGGGASTALDVRAFGVKGDGVTDDTTAFQNAINAACGTAALPGSMVVIPKTFQIKITSTINISQCYGLRLNGQSAIGQAGFGAMILWAGGNGGFPFALNRTRDTILENFSINAFNTSNVPNGCFDIDENSGSGISSHLTFEHILCGMPGSIQNSSFTGVRIGQNAPGNNEQMVFRDVDISCGNGTPNDTSNGKGYQINKVGGAAQPFYVSIIASEIVDCSHGIEVNGNARQVIIDGGNFSANFHSLYLNLGTGVVFENIVTTQDLSSSIYLNGYSGSLEVKNNSFTGGSTSVIDITNASAGAKITVEDNDFGGVGMFNGTDLAGSYSGYVYAKGNSNFTPCPTQAVASFGTFLRNIPTAGTCDEIYAGSTGSMAFNFASRTDGVNNSPPVRWEGGYQNSATPTFATDYWQWQDVIGAGTNGTSTYTLTHSGTTGTLNVSFPPGAPLTLQGATSGSATLSATATGGTLNLGSTNATVTSAGALTVASCTGCAGGGTVTTTYLTSAYTNSTTTFSNVSDGSHTLGFSVAATTNYSVTCNMFYQSSATTAQMDIQWTGPASPTALSYSLNLITNTNGTGGYAVATAFSTVLQPAPTQAITTNFPVWSTLGLINGANAGTITLQARAHGAGTVTIQPGSYCVMTQ